MILIDFKVDEAVLAEDLEEDIINEDYACFLMSYFLMPVRFQVNGIDLFEYKNDPWCEMPIMNLASSGLLTVIDLKKTKKEFYTLIEGPGDMNLMLLADNKVEIAFCDGSKTQVVYGNYDELLEAFQKYADKVRKFMWERVPQLNEHSYWGPWLRGERD